MTIDQFYKLIERAADLGDTRIQTLRKIAGYDCETNAQAVRSNRWRGRRELMLLILETEFSNLLT